MTAQRVLIHDLTQIIDEEPRNVAIIVGAGVSIGALVGTAAQSLASWSGLLRNGIERAREAGGLRADDAQRYVELLSSEDSDAWVLVAEAVTKGLGGQEGGEFRRWLRETVGSFAGLSQETDVLRALSALADSGVLLATVNYDDVLERTTGLWPVTWCQPAKVEHVLRGRSRAMG